MLIPVSQSLVNSFIKKVKDETGVDAREKWSNEDVAEMIAQHVSSSFLNIENIPSDVVTGTGSKSPVQTEIPQAQTTVQETPSEDAQTAPAQAQTAQVQTAPAQAQTTSAQGQTAQPQVQKTAAQIPAQEI